MDIGGLGLKEEGGRGGFIYLYPRGQCCIERRAESEGQKLVGINWGGDFTGIRISVV